MNFFNEISLDSFQSEAIARGLFAVARADGMHEREAALVAAFYAEAGGSASSLAELERREPITAAELQAALSDPPARRLFLKTAALLTLADGSVSAPEKAILSQYAAALDLTAELPAIEEQVKDYLLSHLSHVQNVQAVAEVAKKLSF